MGLLGIWSLPEDGRTTPIDENGQPDDAAPVPVVTGYRDEATGFGFASWEAAQRAQPGYAPPVVEGGELNAQAGVDTPVEDTPVETPPAE